MIPRFSGRPGKSSAGTRPDEHQAADIFRRFFHVLERLDPGTLRGLVEAMTPGAPETKGQADKRQADKRRKRAPARPKAGRAAE